jgi:hypothetical protein
MRRLLVAAGALSAAYSAAAFAPGHLVIVDGAAVYDEAHNYEEEYVVARPAFWTPVVAAWVGTPQSPRTYCLVTFANGTRGLTEWDNVGRAYTVTAADTPLLGVPAAEATTLAVLSKGELVAETGPPATAEDGAVTWRQVVTADGTGGWAAAAALAPRAGD